jgi:hypothetical protein
MVDFPKTLFNADELLTISSGARDAVSGITEDNTVITLNGLIVKDEADLKDVKSKGLKSQYTENIDSLEDICDSAYSTFRNFAKTSAEQTTDMQIAEAANIVVTILRNVNWDLHKLGYKKQLVQLSVLDERMKASEAAAALEASGLKKWYDNLCVATANLRATADKRVDEVEENDHTPTKEAHCALYEHLLKLYNHIDIHEELFPDIYLPAARAFDAILTTVTPEARQRKAKKPNKKTTEQQAATAMA